MKKILSVFAFAAAILAAVPSCTKDDNKGDDNSIITPGGDEGGEGEGEGNTPAELHSSLKGSDYAVIFLDEASGNAIKNQTAVYIGPDDGPENPDPKSYLYVWENTYTAGTCAGVNFYGQAASWQCFVVGSAGWSGLGYNIKSEPAGLPEWRARVAANPESYYLHFAIKPVSDKEVHLVEFGWNDTSRWKAGIGDGFEDKGTVYSEIKPIGGTLVANEWNEFEISVADMGINFVPALQAGGTNTLVFLSGGITGTQINYDAVFIYKK